MISSYAAWLILGMTLITVGVFRIGGYLAGGLLPRQGRLAYVLDRLPAFVLAALLAPAIWDLGWIGAMAAGLVLGVARVTGNALLAMGVGIVAIALARAVGILQTLPMP